MKNRKYQGDAWKSFRKDIIESDGFRCSQCGRNSFDVVLQVHHKKYIKGRKLWEYAGEDCITLCRGCHAMEHGIIMPNFGLIGSSLLLNKQYSFKSSLSR